MRRRYRSASKRACDRIERAILVSLQQVTPAFWLPDNQATINRRYSLHLPDSQVKGSFKQFSSAIPDAELRCSPLCTGVGYRTFASQSNCRSTLYYKLIYRVLCIACHFVSQSITLINVMIVIVY